MNRTRMLLCLPALLAVVLTASPIHAQGSDSKKTDNEKILDALRQIQDDNAQMRLEIGRLRLENAKQQQESADQRHLYDLRDTILQQKLLDLDKRLVDVERAKSRTSNYPTEQPPPSADELRAMKQRLDRLERQEQLQQRSYFIPSETVGPLPATMGTIRITNSSPFACTVTINSTPYRVMPGQSVPILNVPAGLFTYTVVSDGRGLLRSNTVALPANGEKLLDIF